MKKQIIFTIEGENEKNLDRVINGICRANMAVFNRKEYKEFLKDNKIKAKFKIKFNKLTKLKLWQTKKKSL